MNYYSTQDKNLRATLRDAVIQGLAPDNGLYMPIEIPQLSTDFFETLSTKTFNEIGLDVARNLLGDDLNDAVLHKIISHTLQFDAPLVEVEKDVFSLELFHGPTLAFKDFGARFLSGLLSHFASQQDREITILVATSGDTGGAVANAFLNVAGTRVVVLYPAGKVSEVQEKQFTTLGGNITAIEIDGVFDDCQRLVKEAFLDKSLQERLFLTSANSINIARLIPQSFYYFYAYSQLKRKDNPVVFCVPSGNYGNLTAGLLAKRMGLPVSKFIAATNANDIVPEFLHTQKFAPRPSVHTISNAMDVGNPSNFARMLDLYDHNFAALSADVVGYSFTDERTSQAMKQVNQQTGYVLDPHGAVGYLGLKEYMQANPDSIGIFLETAHPAKFHEVVGNAINTPVKFPTRLEQFMKGEKHRICMSNQFDELRSFLLS